MSIPQPRGGEGATKKFRRSSSIVAIPSAPGDPSRDRIARFVYDLAGRPIFRLQAVSVVIPCPPVLRAASSFDHLVGEVEQGWRYHQPDRLRSVQIDDQLESVRLLDRDVGGPGAAKNLDDLPSFLPVDLR